MHLCNTQSWSVIQLGSQGIIAKQVDASYLAQMAHYSKSHSCLYQKDGKHLWLTNKMLRGTNKTLP